VPSPSNRARRVESVDRPTRSRLTPLLLVTVLATAGALLVLAVPRTIAALYAAPSVEVIGALNRPGGRAPDIVQLVDAQQGLALARIWQNDATLAVELARIDLILALRQLRSGLDAKPLLDQSIEMAKAGLHAAPAQARGWLVLSEAILARDGLDAAPLAAYLVESLRASRYDLGLAPNRAWLAMLIWDRLDTSARQAAAVQMRMLIDYRGMISVVRLAKQAGSPNPAREALSADPALRQNFEALYLQL
jgi:hypothetical protein